jgi:hypothetical protein
MSFPEAQDVKGELSISTGDLNKYLPATVKAEYLIDQGFEPQEKIRNGYWWRVKDQVPAICQHLVDKTNAVKERAAK